VISGNRDFPDGWDRHRGNRSIDRCDAEELNSIDAFARKARYEKNIDTARACFTEDLRIPG
jgi:hypothetical protein